MPPVRTMQGIGAVRARRFCLTSTPAPGSGGRRPAPRTCRSRRRCVQHRPHCQALQQRAPRDVLGQLLDRHAGLDPAHVGLAEDELVEGNVPRHAQGDLGCDLTIGRSPRRAGREPLSRPHRAHHEISSFSSPSGGCSAAAELSGTGILGCWACIQSAACCALLAAVKMARGSSLSTSSQEER